MKTNDSWQKIRDALELSERQAAAMWEDLTKTRAAIARFLIPHRGHISDCWLDHFVECGAVTFDGIGYVHAVPVALNAGKGYVPMDDVKPLLEALDFAANDLCGTQEEALAALACWATKHPEVK